MAKKPPSLHGALLDILDVIIEFRKVSVQGNGRGQTVSTCLTLAEKIGFEDITRRSVVAAILLGIERGTLQPRAILVIKKRLLAMCAISPWFKEIFDACDGLKLKLGIPLDKIPVPVRKTPRPRRRPKAAAQAT